MKRIFIIFVLYVFVQPIQLYAEDWISDKGPPKILECTITASETSIPVGTTIPVNFILHNAGSNLVQFLQLYNFGSGGGGTLRVFLLRRDQYGNWLKIILPHELAPEARSNVLLTSSWGQLEPNQSRVFPILVSTAEAESIESPNGTKPLDEKDVLVTGSYELQAEYSFSHPQGSWSVPGGDIQWKGAQFPQPMPPDLNHPEVRESRESAKARAIAKRTFLLLDWDLIWTGKLQSNKIPIALF